MQLCGSLNILWHCLSLGLGWKAGLFQSCGHYRVFHICWHIECSTFTASSFRIWNNSTGILSSPLALFIMMLPNAHLTSYSRMSGSRWLITPSWLSFLYSSSVNSCHLFLISSVSVLYCSFCSLLFFLISYHFCSLLFPSLLVPLVSLNFLEEIS